MHDLPAFVPTLNDVAEPFRHFYRQADGQFALDLGEYSQDAAEERERSIAERDAEIDRLRSALEHHLLEGAARAEIAAQRGAVDLLMPHVRGALRLCEEGGEFFVNVIDKEGNVRDGVSVHDLVAEMRESEVFGRAFDAENTTGSGMTSTVRAGSVAPPGTLSRAEAKDPARYREAREEALREGRLPIIVD